MPTMNDETLHERYQRETAGDFARLEAVIAERDAEIARLWMELGSASEKLMIAGTDNAGLRAELAQARKLTLTVAELREALLFSDGEDDEADETEVVIGHLDDGPLDGDDDGKRGPGLFCWFADYPEEGVYLLCAAIKGETA